MPCLPLIFRFVDYFKHFCEQHQIIQDVYIVGKNIEIFLWQTVFDNLTIWILFRRQGFRNCMSCLLIFFAIWVYFCATIVFVAHLPSQCINHVYLFLVLHEFWEIGKATLIDMKQNVAYLKPHYFTRVRYLITRNFCTWHSGQLRHYLWYLCLRQYEFCITVYDLAMFRKQSLILTRQR